MNTTQNYQLTYFGQINLTALAEDYQMVVNVNGKDLRIDINFKNRIITQDNIIIVERFLQDIGKFDKQNLIFIDKEFHKEDSETSNYIQFYFDELDEEELAKIISINNHRISKELQLLSKLKIIRVGLYPDKKFDANYFGVFDYTIDIDGEPCNQLLVVKTNEKGDLDHITWES